MERNLAGFLVLGCLVAASGSGSRCDAAATAPQSATPVAQSVQVELRVRGDLFASASATGEPLRRPVRLDAQFDFTAHREPAAGPGGVLRSYRAAEATIEADGQRQRHRLAVDAGRVLVRLEGTTPTPFLPDGFLSRDEAELLDIPFDPALVDGLRPEQAMATGDSWKIPADLVAGLLAIDTVESGGIEATLESVTANEARLRLAGTVVGGVDGAATRLEIVGTATVAASADEKAGQWRLTGSPSTLEVTISERREAGWVAPGLEVEATVVMHCTPLESDLPDDPSAPLPSTLLAPAPADRPRGEGRPGFVWHLHRLDRYSMVVDSRWRVVEDGPEGLVLRLIDRGALLAQCSILPLARGPAAGAEGEETVCDDVRRSLGDQFGLIAEAEAISRDDGTQVVRVVADGSAEDRPFRWMHYVLTTSEGHRAAVTFMLEPALVERFAAADRELVAGMVVLPSAPARQAAAEAAVTPR
jgi:hypothetical protein